MKIILISFLMIMLVPVRIFATEEADPLSVYDFSDINSVLKDDNAFNFEDCVRKIIKVILIRDFLDCLICFHLQYFQSLPMKRQS